jgi:polar amino acid transport system substrate-binding protein
MKKWMYAAALLVALFSAGAASAQSVSDIVGRGKVRIGVLTGAPPYGMIDVTGKAIGYDADVAALVGKYLNLPVEIVALSPPSRIPALEAGKVDFLVATLAPTAERAKAVMFTMPYSMFQVYIYSKKATAIKGWADLKGMKVGVNRGSSVEPDLVAHQSMGLTVVRFEDDSTTMQALFSGQVDAVAEPDAQANAALKVRGDADMETKFLISKQPNSMTVKHDAFELHQWLNNAIYLMKLNGDLDAICRKWIGSPLPDMPVF